MTGQVTAGGEYADGAKAVGRKRKAGHANSREIRVLGRLTRSVCTLPIHRAAFRRGTNWDSEAPAADIARRWQGRSIRFFSNEKGAILQKSEKLKSPPA